MEAEAKWKFNWEAPRWAKVGDAVKNAAIMHDLELTINISKGLLTEYGTAKVEGKEVDVQSFKLKIEIAIQEYNS